MGISPVGENAIGGYQFQKMVFEISSKLEEITLESCKYVDKDVIILYDRGILDSKAYMNKKDFKKLLEEYSKKEIDYINLYDLVIHLRTAAFGKEEFYTLENNKARSESPEQARERDDLTLNAWLGHPKLKIIDNETGFDEKINRVVNEIYHLVGKPYLVQRQYKYLVDSIDVDKLNSMFQITKLEIEQYIDKEDNKEIIYRRTIKDNEESYKVITKVDTEIDNERITKQKRISDRDYYMSIPTNSNPIKKIRYCFEYKNQYFRLDLFENGLKILEIEETNKTKKITLPDFINAFKDITNDINYRNSNIYKELNDNKVKKL